ncbi:MULTISPECIES: ROK family protein [unclassified Curtobacterium]|uniref:ROK family protein n=1 Tax=unclassified Curtobacterium TaxID=257496 RepID=UPI000D95BF0F|nr:MULTISPECIES: ROK family protein [unclassified Curtobacterium]PYY38350.1 ROK family protein [Curtobacterium sp. MCBD17_030]PZE39695.1 ROK family protein [Curtobacterium sp. MCPF17_031]PZF14798.1 ROK family protein [Curtobacterium sp. MCPF17_011]
MNVPRPCRVGVDLGGTGSRAIGVVDREIVKALDVPTAELGAGTEAERVDRLARLIEDVVPAGAELTAVGIGASGPVDVVTGVVHNGATLPWFSGFPLVARLEARLRVPVGIDNDAVAAAFGERGGGAGEQSDRLLMVTLGTGVGVAMLVDGRPVRGADGAHPEGGHIPISSAPERCYCGLTGCFEQAASRTTLQRRLSEAMRGKPIERGLIGEAMTRAQDDDRVRAVFHEYAVSVGRGLAALHTLWQPRVTVLGGSAAVCLPLIRDDVLTALDRSEDYRVDVDLRAATLGDNAGAIGAALAIAPGSA